MSIPMIDAALGCAKLGWYIFPLGEKSKVTDVALAPHSHKSASNDVNQIIEWWTTSPNANIGIDLGRSNLTVLDFDKGEPPAELNLNGALRVKTVRGTHVYFSGTTKQGDMYFHGTHVGEIKSDGGYVLAPNSVHPDGPMYTVGGGALHPLPVGLLDKLRGERKASPTIQGDKISHGKHDTELTRIAGKLRFDGLEENGIYEAIVEVCEKRCENYGTDYREMCRKIAQSVSRYAVGESATAIVMNQKPDVASGSELEIDDSEAAARPVFPLWTIEGTSIYEGLVAPALLTSSKHAEFIMMPSIQIFLNYLSGLVRVGLSNTNHNIYVGLVSPYGQFFKSSSCKLAMDYFTSIGLFVESSKDLKDASGRVVSMQAGSPEGFGLRMQKMSALHAILVNDELGKFVSKAGIEGSSFSSDLLTWYGAASFGNSTTNQKNQFSFEAGSYTFGWLWATTDRGFNRHWPKLAGISSGLEDRMFFVVSPEKPNPVMAIYGDPLFQEAAKRTHQLINKAIKQGKYGFESPETFAKKVDGLDPRSIDLVQKLALYLAVDLDSPIIDDDHVERAVALVQYRNQAAKFLAPIEADNDEGRTQKEILRELRQNRGKLSYRDLTRAMDYTSMGLFKWDRAYKGLVSAGLIFEFHQQQTTGKRAVRMVGLAKEEG